MMKGLMLLLAAIVLSPGVLAAQDTGPAAAPPSPQAPQAPAKPAAPTQAASAPEQDGTPMSAVFVLGPQYVNDLDRGRARFEEFRDVPQGFAFEFARFAWTPAERNLLFSATAIDVGQRDQRYVAQLDKPGTFRVFASFEERPRLYSTGSRTLWSGVGSGNLTLSEGFRQGAESAAGPPAAPFASAALLTYMQTALNTAPAIDLETRRKDFNAGLDFDIASGLLFNVTGNFGARDGTRPLGFGTYIRRQALAGVPNTGTGFFWRETIEARGSELVQPVDHRVTEGSATLTWTKHGHMISGGWFGSAFRNNASTLFFDNPFEASPGRASATAFTPASDQEPSAPLGNNNLRGLYARSAVQLEPDNAFNRIFATGSFKLSPHTRLTAVVARGMYSQNDPFLPYAENDQVVFSQPGEPIVYARDAALPQPSLDAERSTTQVDLRATTRVGIVSPRINYRYYDFDDERPSIQFPGYSSSGDSYFRRAIGQTLNGQKALFNVVGGYTRQRFDVGAGVKVGSVVTLDAEYIRTAWDYEARQVDATTDNAFRGTVRVLVGGHNINGFYQHAKRDYEGQYAVGLETSGVRAYDVWTRDRDQVGAEADIVLSDVFTVNLGASYWKDDYPGAVPGFQYGYGLQDSMNGAFHVGLTWAREQWMLAAFTGYETYEWNSLQVTKTSQTVDYNPTNRWTRESSDKVFWVGVEGEVPIAERFRARGDINWQKFSGDWITANLAAPDVNSAIAYPYPSLSDSTFTLRASLLWAATPRVTIEGRYWFEPFRLDDFTWDLMQPYMQGVFKETRSAPNDIGDMNVSRFLFLDARYTDYTAHVVSAFVHVRF